MVLKTLCFGCRAGIVLSRMATSKRARGGNNGMTLTSPFFDPRHPSAYRWRVMRLDLNFVPDHLGCFMLAAA